MFCVLHVHHKKDHKKMKSAVNPNYYINNDGFNPIKNINDDIYGGTMANNQNIPESSSDNIQVDCGDVDDLDCKNSTNDDYQFLSKIPFLITSSISAGLGGSTPISADILNIIVSTSFISRSPELSASILSKANLVILFIAS